MLNQQIIADAEAHLNQRRANVAAIEFRDPLIREFSTQQIRDSVPEQALKLWLEEGLPGNIQLPALYVIEVDEQDVADQLKNSFDAARADKNRGYVLPMRNDAVDGSTVLYVGSSRKIRQRLKQHLWQAPVGTYALNLRRWVPAIEGNIRVKVQNILGEPDPITIQDAEDALWRSLRPMFGKAGGR